MSESPCRCASARGRGHDGFVAQVAAALVEAAGRPADGLDVQVIAAALVWALIAAARHWYTSGFANPLEHELQRALTLVEHGLHLD